MVFFEYDAEAEKGSPSWTALWFLHNSYSYGSFLLGNNLISAEAYCNRDSTPWLDWLA